MTTPNTPTSARAGIEAALAAGPISKLAQRATDLHEKADMPWDDADELALRENGLSEDALCDVIADFGLIDHDGVRLMSDQDIKNLVRHVLVWSPIQIHHDAEKKALEGELVRVRGALESIALAGMSPSPEMSENGIEAWHARQAWRFIGIAARAISPEVKE